MSGSGSMLKLAKKIAGLVFLFFSIPVFCQIHINTDNLTRESLLAQTESYLGTNDLLVNGRLYFSDNSLANGHPFFISHEFLFADIYIKGNEFTNQAIKYDLVKDLIILKAVDKEKQLFPIILNNAFIDSLMINGTRMFINFHQQQEPFLSGYYEKIYDGQFSFYIKYSKFFVNEYNTANPFGKYTDQKRKMFLVQEGSAIELNSKKSFLNYFSNDKKEIKRYFKQHKIRYKKINNIQLYNLLAYCEQFI